MYYMYKCTFCFCMHEVGLNGINQFMSLVWQLELNILKVMKKVMNCMKTSTQYCKPTVILDNFILFCDLPKVN